MTTLEKVKEKIREAVPEIGNGCDCEWCAASDSRYRVKRPIRLADVLAAIEKAGKGNEYTMVLYMGGIAVFMPNLLTGSFEYNLRADSLDEQSPETIEFLGSILGV